MDGDSELKALKPFSCTTKSIIWSLIMLLLLVTMLLTFDNIYLIRPQHIGPEKPFNDLIMLQNHRTLEKDDELQKTDSRVFEITRSQSHLDFVEKIKSSGYDCGKVWKNSNLTKTQVDLNYLNHTTGYVEFTIQTYNHLNQRKTIGGDIYVVWAEEQSAVQNPMSSRRTIAGSVTDNLNGSYTGQLQILWNGRFTVYTRLLSIPRTQCLRFKAMEKYGNSVFSLLNPFGIFFTFNKGDLKDSTRCSPIDFIYGYDELCNFTTLNYNYSYYCGHPSAGLNCSDFSTFNMRKYNLDHMDLHVRRSEDDIIYNPGWGKLEKTINITISNLTDRNLPNSDTLSPCHSVPITDSWTMSSNQIFIQNNSWGHISCKPTEFTTTNIKRCLTNKKLFFIGDSTVRQYVDAIGAQIKERVKYFPFHVKLYSERDNINITWRKHELPFHNVAFRDPHQVNSTDNQLKNIAQDPTIQESDLIIVLTYNTHLQAFPPYIFRDRIKRVVKTLKVLFAKKPLATVLFKGPHVTNVSRKWFDARISLVYMEILLEEFASITDKVRYLDVFTLSVLNDDQSLHPRGQALVSQLQQFLSYICP